MTLDSTTDGKAIKIASMIDEHTRLSLLNIVERSITAEDLVDELQKVFAAAGGPPKVLRLDNGPEMISQALQQFCEDSCTLAQMARTATPGSGGPEAVTQCRPTSFTVAGRSRTAHCQTGLQDMSGRYKLALIPLLHNTFRAS
jgi:hypothetical protein